MWPGAKECEQLLGTGIDKEWILPRNAGFITIFLFPTSDLLNCKINLCYFKPTSLW